MYAAASFSRAEIRKQIVQLAWPVIAEQLLMFGATFVDTILVGHLGAVAMAAVGFTQMPQWLLVGLFAGLGVGVNALVARFYGADEHEQIEAATRAGFWLGLITSAVAGVLVFLSAPWIMRALGAEPEVAPAAMQMLRLLVPGMAASLWMSVMTAALRATGDTRTSMVLNVGINVVNAVLAYSLIYGHFGAPALGLAGAGIATTTARLLGAGVLAVVLFRRRDGARLSLNGLFHIDTRLLGRILRVGLVSSSERMFSTVIYLGYARMIATLGTVSVAAQNLAVNAENICWMLGTGFSMASAAMVGQRLGARRVDQAEAVIREAALMSMALLGAIGLFFIVLPGPYIALFTQDEGVRTVSASVLRIAGFAEVATALVLTLNGALSGAGDTKPLFLVTIGGGLVRLGLAALFILGMGTGLQGAWIAASCDWFARAGLIWLRYRSGVWKEVTV